MRHLKTGHLISLSRAALVLALGSGVCAATAVQPPTPVAQVPGAVLFDAQWLADGTALPAHASLSSDPSDAAGARRREEILASPYTQIAAWTKLRGGEIEIGFEAAATAESREAFTRGVGAAAAALFDRDGWSRPFSMESPLRVVLTRGRSGQPGIAGWSGREHDELRDAVVAVGEGPGAVLDAVHQIALLSLRQVAPQESGWAVEGLAEWLARRVTGFVGPLAPAGDPLVAESGSLESPATLASFLEALSAHVAAGAVRLGWEQAGAEPGDDAEAFVKAIARDAHPQGLSGLLADLLSDRLRADTAVTASDAARSSRPRWAVGSDLTVALPPTLGWRRLALQTAGERGGVEVLVGEVDGVSAVRAVLFYRGLARADSDAVPLAAGAPFTVPLAGTGELDLLLVDGAPRIPRAADVVVRLQHVPDYPAALVASGAEWTGDSLEITWRTSSHRDLLAWIVTRYVEREDGTLVESGRELVPTTNEAPDGFEYRFADPAAQAGRSYLYRVHALTRSGLLSEAFETALTGRSRSGAAAPPADAAAR